MKTAKWDKPLSRRAYEKIKEKALIGVTIAGRELDFEEFVETIDTYIEKGKVVLPWCDHHDIYDIIFHMIKDDIDTAMRRSREARERAALRRKTREEIREDAHGNDCDAPHTAHAETGQPDTSLRQKPAGRHSRHKSRRYNEKYGRLRQPSECGTDNPPVA